MHLLLLSFPEACGASIVTEADRDTTAAEKVLLVGIGNPDRGDDGIGPLVARQLAGRVSPGIAIIERTGDALALIEDWAGRYAAVLVDAAAPGTAPGRIDRIDLLKDELLPELALSSTHAFGIVDAVGLARTLGLLPRRLIVYAIEGVNFAPGASLTPEIAGVVNEVVARVVAELEMLNHGMAEVPGQARCRPRD
jgi:hydrogenase maturation protease